MNAKFWIAIDFQGNKSRWQPCRNKRYISGYKFFWKLTVLKKCINRLLLSHSSKSKGKPKADFQLLYYSQLWVSFTESYFPSPFLHCECKEQIKTCREKSGQSFLLIFNWFKSSCEARQHSVHLTES